MDGTRIVLVRHGESLAQEQGFLGGHDGCRGLSHRGRDQAALLRDRVRATGELSDATVLYTSLMPRAIETAEILSSALNGLEVHPECRFCEGHPGEADGLSWAELDQQYPSADWQADARRAPGWETWTEMAVRVSGALQSLVERHPGETVVVACHGGVVVHSMLHFLSLDAGAPAARAWLSPDNTSLTEWRFAPNPYVKDTLPVELVRFNDAAHLPGRTER